jgi:hypothetical protein
LIFTLDLVSSGLFVQALGITLLSDSERSIGKDLQGFMNRVSGLVFPILRATWVMVLSSVFLPRGRECWQLCEVPWQQHDPQGKG